MILWALVIAASIAASEAILRLPLLAEVRNASRYASKSMAVLRSSHISDHWKEQILPAYAFRIGRGSVVFFLYLCLALAPVAALGLLYPPGFAAWGEALMRPMVIAVLCVTSLVYLWLRTRGAPAPATPGYSAADQRLHRMALGAGPVAEVSHDLERAMFLKSAPEDSGAHVFVTGLARAGTTILMREIHATGAFGSLTYADMPFVLAPNLWAKLSSKGRTPGPRAERAHGDGIEVDTQSPEALDEVFWRVTEGGSYITPEGLWPHEPDADQIAAYRDLMRLVMRKTGTTRYVSKNNNNILRLPALADAMPEATFLVPLRRPLAHAESLLSQHRRFLNADAFTQDYMTWLGHHEFGATHRPFLFPDAPEGDPNGIDYWLRAWLSAYRALDLAEADRDNVLFVPYEALSADPAVWAAVARRIGLPASPATELRPVPDAPPGPHDPALAAEATALHARLAARAAAKLGAPKREV